MNIDEIKWRHPCGCAGCTDPVAEFRYSGGWVRVTRRETGYTVTQFGHDKRLVSGTVEMTEDEFAALIG